ncbi:MAG: hypothetical protein ACYCV0_15290 [Desulfitobacteriaceae bacterium]
MDEKLAFQIRQIWDISPEVVFTILQTSIKDIDRFLGQVALYISDNNL